MTNHSQGFKTLVVIHYAGHGVISKGTTNAILNDPDKSLYPIEKVVHKMSKLEGGYVMTLLDCCRDSAPPLKSKSISGISNNLDETSASKENLLILFGCPAGERTNPDSSLIQSFFAHIKASRLKNNSVILPGKLRNF